MDFKKKIGYIRENPHYKSGETMTVEEAKYYLDAAFNLTYSFPMESFEDFNTQTFTVTLPKTDDQVSLEDVSAAYYDLKAQTLVIYNATEGEVKELYVSHMQILNNTSAEVVFETSATIGSRGIELPPPIPTEWGPFEEGDDWMYGEKLGDCYGNWEDDYDAATEICSATNTYRYKYIQDEGPGWVAFYTEPSAIGIATVFDDEVQADLLANPNDDETDNYEDYYLLYQVTDPTNNLDVHTCIEWEEMNYYYHGTHKVIYQIIQENYNVYGVHASLTFLNCEMIEGKHYNGTAEDPDEAYHRVLALYKTRHILGGNYEPTSIGDE
ncbi:MAG: hypothetical protein K9H58_16370 [Bacteroidales bacterium]|nr:hypothetical protein [Bacteroidales bacterium]